MNISSGDIDMSGVSFTNGIEFIFPADVSSMLGPGERILLVKNLTAFELRYGNAVDIRIVGEFTNNTNLRNSGERIELLGINGMPIRDFTYNDKAPWPEAADDGGFSLVLDLPHSNPDHGLPTNWRSSAGLGGSPGSSDTQMFIGDPIADDDRDGLTRLLEYAIGSSDANPASGLNAIGCDIESFTVSDLTDYYLVFSFRRNLAAEGIRYTVEHSSDLRSWNANAAVLIDETNLGDGTAMVRYRNPAPKPASGRGYLRLKVDFE